MSRSVSVLIGSRKGAFVLSSDAARKNWTLSPPLFLGHIIYHIVCDPRNPKRLVMAAKTGHLGPTVYHSSDSGKSWEESKTPPAFPKLAEGEKGRTVDSVFWLTPGHASRAGKWYAGTAPAGLFLSEDHGANWQPVNGFNENPEYANWAKLGASPAGQMVHSINIHPADPNKMYLGISVGGVFESNDQGASWEPLNKGCAADFLPDENEPYGHDPHCMALHPIKPERLYQQNHCGIYRIDRPSNEWQRIGKNMPAEVGDIGFPIVLNPHDPDNVWVFPMDGSTVWPRTSPDGKPAVYMSKDAGASWSRQDKGLPAQDAYFTVKRQAMSADNCQPLGLYFGTSQGEVWGSIDEGESWSCLVKHLPEIYSITIKEQGD